MDFWHRSGSAAGDPNLPDDDCSGLTQAETTRTVQSSPRVLSTFHKKFRTRINSMGRFEKDPCRNASRRKSNIRRSLGCSLGSSLGDVERKSNIRRSLGCSRGSSLGDVEWKFNCCRSLGGSLGKFPGFVGLRAAGARAVAALRWVGGGRGRCGLARGGCRGATCSWQRSKPTRGAQA